MNKANPQVVIIAGPNGAGKSTLAPVLLRDTFGLLEFVNADTISAGLSAFNAEAVALDAGRVMLTRLRNMGSLRQLRRRLPFVNRERGKRTGFNSCMARRMAECG